jgi:single-strand DNA-binding protein
MDASNLVVLRGVVTGAPRPTELPSGSIVTHLAVTTRSGDVTTSVPVVVHDREVAVATGDDVLVAGRVQRRFFRAGGSTQSRTEVVAAELVPARRTRSAARVQRAVLAALDRQ